jgi:hypothetical protein
VTEPRTPHATHLNRPSPNRQPLRPWQAGQTKPVGPRSRSRQSRQSASGLNQARNSPSDLGSCFPARGWSVYKSLPVSPVRWRVQRTSFTLERARTTTLRWAISLHPFSACTQSSGRHKAKPPPTKKANL